MDKRNVVKEGLANNIAWLVCFMLVITSLYLTFFDPLNHKMKPSGYAGILPVMAGLISIKSRRLAVLLLGGAALIDIALYILKMHFLPFYR